MYAYIKGELAETNPDHIVIETGGIGYQVFISGQTFEYLPAVGEEIKVYTYLFLRSVQMICGLRYCREIPRQSRKLRE